MPGVAAVGSGCDGCTGRGHHRRASLWHRSLFTGSNWPLQRVRSVSVERATVSRARQKCRPYTLARGARRTLAMQLVKLPAPGRVCDGAGVPVEQLPPGSVVAVGIAGHPGPLVQVAALDQQRDTKYGPWRQGTGMPLPSAVSALGDQAI